MRLANVQTLDGSRRVASVSETGVTLFDLSAIDGIVCLADLLHAENAADLALRFEMESQKVGNQYGIRFLAPIDRQEVWAAGVTYKRSQVARMEESETGATHYDRVYTAKRPELFFKATPHRVVGPNQPIRVRNDSRWTVPEPELALVISPDLELVGYTIGNDMSARDIEGENPLYLPQAKLYDDCCALGPTVLLADQPLNLAETKIILRIRRGTTEVFADETNLGQMARSFDELIDWLGNDNSFPHGVILLTGTGIVPPDQFTLQSGDVVTIEISGIGSLANPVVQSRR